MALSERLTRPAVNAQALAGIGLALAAVIIFSGNYDVKAGENGGTGPALGTAAICIVLAALLFGLVVPRVGNLDKTALVLGILGIVSIAVFWLGVTPVFAAAAIAVTRRGDTGPPRAVVIVESLAALATVLAVAVSLGNLLF